ncbi:MAG: hypothetical protein P4L55_08385 [Syntrophobacteraceae bacterium]|nr:hypothetical protein [Syntrophobacteraceae bacterium]
MGELSDAFAALDNSNSSPGPAVSPPSNLPAGGELTQAFHNVGQSQATGNLLAAQGANPDSAARADELSRQLAVPQPVVEGNLTHFEQIAQLKKNRQIAGQNTGLQNLVIDNPLAARIAQDDFEQLDLVSKLTASLSSGYQQAQLGDELSNINTKKMLHISSLEDDQRAQQIQGQLQSSPQYPGAWGVLQRGTGMGTGIVKSAERALPVALGYAGVAGLATEGVGAVPAFFTGLGYGISGDFARQAAANTYAKLDTLKDASGQPLAESTKYLGASIAGSITFFAAHYGGEQINKVTQLGLGSLVDSALEEAVARPTISSSLGRIAGTLAKGSLTGAGVNGLMATANMIGEQAARTITPNIRTILTDPEQQAEFKTELIHSIEEGAEMFPLMELPGAGMHFMGDMFRARQAHTDAQALTDLAQGVTQSKTWNRSVQTFVDFMRRQTEGTPVENMSIDGKAVLELYQRAGVADPTALPPEKDHLLGWLPDRDQQLREAKETGGQIVVPSADFISRLSGTNAFNELLPDVRVRQDGVTLREASDTQGIFAQAKEMMEATQQLGDNHAKGLEQDQPMQRVYNDLYPRAVEAGYEPRVADHYARIVAAEASSAAEREPGIYQDAWDAYQREGLQVKRGGEGGILNQASLFQGAPAVPKTPEENMERGSEAMANVMRDHVDVLDAMHRSDLGGVSFYWGEPGKGEKLKGGQGVSHLIARRNMEGKDGEAIARKMVEVIARGEIEKPSGPEGGQRVNVRYDNHTAVLSLYRFGNKRTWLLTGWDDQPSGATPEVYDSESTTHVKPTRFQSGMGAEGDTENNINPLGRDGKPLFQSRGSSGRSIPTTESLPENPIPLEHIKEYDDLQREAARRAWAQVEKEHGKQVRLSEKQLREQGGQLYGELTTSRVLEAVKEHGISRKSLNDQDQEAVITPLVRKYPGLFREKGTNEIDVLAHDYGYEKTDDLIQDMMNAKGKRQFLDDYVEEQKQRTGQELGLSPEEWQTRLLEKEQEIFKELTKSAPDSRLAKMRERMGANASLQLPAGGFGTGPHIMNIFAVKDRSSFMHEAGHLFLERLLHDATHPEGSERAKSDLGVLQKWWADHAEQMHDQFHQARKEAEASVKASPGDEQARARVETYRSAAKLLGESPEEGVQFFKDFAGHLGRDMERGDARMSLMTPLHEMFARTFEAYLMEGKAPSPGLQPVFDSFRTWLKRIYERVTGRGRALAGLSQVAGTPIEVSPEVRGVMDRILATDEQIDVAKQQQRVGKIFKDAKAAGMTSAEWKAYNGLVGKAVDEARAQVQKRAMAQMKREKSEEWEKQKEELRPEVEGEINSRKDLRALHYLRRGTMLGAEEEGENKAPVRMNRAAVVKLIGEDGLRNLPYGTIRKEGGFDPQEVGEMFGYRSGSEMLTDLLALEQEHRALDARGVAVDGVGGYREHLIDEALDARLKEHFGDMTTDGTMPQAAMDAIHNDSGAQALAMELRALIRQTGKQHPIFGPVADARAWARATIGDRKIWEVENLNRYATDERRSAQAAEEAMAKGDLQGAIAAKRQQILNSALYREAQRARDSLAGLEERAKLFAKKRMIANMDQGALDQIHTLLERFGLKAPDLTAQGRQVLTEWLAEQRDMGADVKVSGSLFDATLPGRYKDLTVSRVQDLSDAIKSIAHVGRRMKQIEVAGKRADLEATVAALARSAYDNVEFKEFEKERNPGVVQGDFQQRAKARWYNAKVGLGSFHATLAAMEQELIDRLDGKDPNGPWNKVIFRRIKDARAYENQLREMMAQGLRDLKEVYPGEEQDKLGDMLPPIKELPDNRTGDPTVLSKGELISLALNWGNESNRSKLCKGEAWKPDAVQAVFDQHMSKHDWNFVQGIWDLLEKLRPEISARELRMTGVEPIWIDAATVTTPHGEYRGGYYPMSYDPERSGDAMDRLLDNAAQMMDAGRAGRPQTDKGYTVGRVERYARPVRLSMDVLSQHVDTVVRDLAWRESIYDLTRLFKNAGVRWAINSTVGAPMYDQIIPWLKRTIGDRPYDVTGNNFWAGRARWLRINTTMMGLGYRISTMLVHGASAGSLSVGEIGAKWFAHGIGQFYGSPEKMARMRDFVYSRSSEMAHRMETVDRDIRDGLRDLVNKEGPVAKAKRFAYYGISMLDMGSALPTWLGAYEKALAPEAEGGMGMKNEPDAIYFADKSVRNAHGSGNAEDLPAIQFGNEFQKLTTMFYTFWGRFYNRQVDIGRDWAGAIKSRDAGDFAAVLARSWWYFVMPVIAHTVIKGQSPKDGEGWLEWAAKELGLSLFSGIPVARDIANWKLGGNQYRPSPVVSAIEAYGSAWSDLEKLGSGQEPSKHWLKHAADTVGYSFGLPLGQVDQSLQYLWDVGEGEQNPEDAAQFVRELVMGSSRRK